MKNTELYPLLEPYNTGTLSVSPLHTLYYEEAGNPQGTPIVILHGGPGGASNPDKCQMFDPTHYRIIQFDQRGCGQSTPFCELADNTTHHLVEDIEKLRKHLGISAWHVVGSSW